MICWNLTTKEALQGKHQKQLLCPPTFLPSPAAKFCRQLGGARNPAFTWKTLQFRNNQGKWTTKGRHKLQSHPELDILHELAPPSLWQWFQRCTRTHTHTQKIKKNKKYNKQKKAQLPTSALAQPVSEGCFFCASRVTTARHNAKRKQQKRCAGGSASLMLPLPAPPNQKPLCGPLHSTSRHGRHRIVPVAS